MRNKLKLTKNESSDIGFAKSSLISEAITLDEFNEWVIFIIDNYPVDELPIYLFDLVDFQGYLCDLIGIIGFTPNSELNESENNALYGIAIKRFGNIIDCPISYDCALNALNNNPHVLTKFREIFPFIDLNF
ncbi:hypothetical protein ACU6T4_11620 [Avibacterium paragallinarum]|uniref:hypothetical protein n=1 Tax=Avibacterium TaxID=292486 RepID=UPI00021ACF66|nr:hypothetical protein [Avibacterium paragallinarum]QIR12156.1 hypothetical protein HBL79_07940 [Avibacterium paragallinarum]QJE09022.1 hypothetical protein HHJ62_01100 [Avibacterium paragallinarum]QJE11219.1 hypothetical protein HHJ61_01100 [Avibacterium paragallinarum]QJE13417.1 hypothetical protein HHJ60_01105 [Avibacterium paragallinarum]QJE15617.1 hypothetical protein HHJ59_01095 [Avibacterium paragallinarum]